MLSFTLAQELDKHRPRPFFIVETFQTSDGLRRRICDEKFTTLEKAAAAIIIKRMLADSQENGDAV